LAVSQSIRAEYRPSMVMAIGNFSVKYCHHVLAGPVRPAR